MPTLTIRSAEPHEHVALGRLMVDVYSRLEGFPQPETQPRYYELLANVGAFAQKKDVELLVALMDDALAGGVVYFGDMAEYGSGGTATQVKNASGIRLLAVDPAFRGAGIGKALTVRCIERARERGHAGVILHTTQAMQLAWRMYETLGFTRLPDLDFLQGELPVYGFRLPL